MMNLKSKASPESFDCAEHKLHRRIQNLKFVVVVGALLFALGSRAEAQQAKGVPRVGYLASGSVEIEKGLLAAFEQGLRELGYSEGKNIVLERRYAAGRSEMLPELAAELIRLKVDVLVTTSPGAYAAKKATSTTPIVIHEPDPIATGLVASLAHPGGNLTGVADLHADMVSKRLELLKQVAPSASRVAVLLNPANPSHPLQLKAIQAAAPTFGVAVSSINVSGPDDIDSAFAALKKERPGGFLVLGDRVLGTHGKSIAEFAIKSRMPVIFTNARWVDAGGLMSYGANFFELYRRMAVYVDKILKGAKPADLPVEQPTKFELVINLKTAKQIGLTIPPNVLARVDRVIK